MRCSKFYCIIQVSNGANIVSLTRQNVQITYWSPVAFENHIADNFN